MSNRSSLFTFTYFNLLLILCLLTFHGSKQVSRSSSVSVWQGSMLCLSWGDLQGHVAEGTDEERHKDLWRGDEERVAVDSWIQLLSASTYRW